MPHATHRRVNLAVEQLDVALELFLEKRSYVSALTLAGAAEEILGTAAVLAGEKPILRHHYDTLAPYHQLLHREPLEWKDYANMENFSRNVSKHMDSGTEDHVEFDTEISALRMLVRACANYDSLGLPRTERMCAFDNWFYENVVGV